MGLLEVVMHRVAQPQFTLLPKIAPVFICQTQDGHHPAYKLHRVPGLPQSSPLLEASGSGGVCISDPGGVPQITQTPNIEVPIQTLLVYMFFKEHG